MYLAKQISTGLYINDFQDKATPDGLIQNAVSRGIPAEDIEVVEVTPEQFSQVVGEYTLAARQLAEAERIAYEEDLQNFKQSFLQQFQMDEAQFKKLSILLHRATLE